MTHPDLAHFPVVVPAIVHWGEMDAYGHLNNTVFFRFFETARMAYLERCGFLASYERDRIGAILHSTDCRFRAPLFYPDDVLIGARVLDTGADRFRMGYRVVSVGQNRVAADGTGVIVSYDYNSGSKVGLPESVSEGIRRLEAADGGTA
jgi:acyl-CoA thioester hydrolase